MPNLVGHLRATAERQRRRCKRTSRSQCRGLHGLGVDLDLLALPRAKRLRNICGFCVLASLDGMGYFSLAASMRFRWAAWWSLRQRWLGNPAVLAGDTTKTFLLISIDRAKRATLAKRAKRA